MFGQELLEIELGGEGCLRHLRELPGDGVEQKDSPRHVVAFRDFFIRSPAGLQGKPLRVSPRSLD